MAKKNIVMAVIAGVHLVFFLFFMGKTIQYFICKKQENCKKIIKTVQYVFMWFIGISLLCMGLWAWYAFYYVVVHYDIEVLGDDDKDVAFKHTLFEFCHLFFIVFGSLIIITIINSGKNNAASVLTLLYSILGFFIESFVFYYVHKNPPAYLQLGPPIDPAIYQAIYQANYQAI